MNPNNFFGELKRRNVYKVAVAYAVVGWLLIQVGTQVFPFFEVPNWAVRVIVLLIAAGFPVALILAWAFELTPEGIKRTEDADLVTPPVSRKQSWIYVVIIAGALSVGLFFLGRYTATNVANLPAKSIAVLPFENLSRDPDNAYFTEGIQDEILARLAKIADLKVISRTSTQRYKSSPIICRISLSGLEYRTSSKAVCKKRPTGFALPSSYSMPPPTHIFGQRPMTES